MCRKIYDECSWGSELVQCGHAEELEGKLSFIESEFKDIITQLYSKQPIDFDILKGSIENIADELSIKMPSTDIQVERKNDTLKSLQFLLHKQAVLA